MTERQAGRNTFVGKLVFDGLQLLAHDPDFSSQSFLGSTNLNFHISPFDVHRFLFSEQNIPKNTRDQNGLVLAELRRMWCVFGTRVFQGDLKPYSCLM